ncbi:hypothetical protein DSO57_1012048 [Entomophthora muscae]|uniref:Uncharacterized protein n=1 Tax=Entomophthora muscae TaxID=34485 RepID=A0ACC2RKY6_9FUNG|nr:hypothetical protein DSO57_1012048 [Entomophthora muscae]
MPLIKNHNCETPPNYSSIINFLAKSFSNLILTYFFEVPASWSWLYGL